MASVAIPLREFVSGSESVSVDASGVVGRRIVVEFEVSRSSFDGRSFKNGFATDVGAARASISVDVDVPCVDFV